MGNTVQRCIAAFIVSYILVASHSKHAWRSMDLVQRAQREKPKTPKTAPDEACRDAGETLYNHNGTNVGKNSSTSTKNADPAKP